MAAHTDLCTQNNAKGRQGDFQNHGWQAINTILQSVSVEGKALSFALLIKSPLRWPSTLRWPPFPQRINVMAPKTTHLENPHKTRRYCSNKL